MKEKMYIPKPEDTSKVILPKEMEELLEMLAKNTHEVWSVNRIKEGWKYGEIRDDVKKLHPDLVPYEKLTESEKDYDRNTAMETLKLIMKLGYKIEKDDKE